MNIRRVLFRCGYSLSLLTPASFLTAVEADPSVLRQTALTSQKTLPNGAVFVQRELPGSDIAHFEVNIAKGQADLPENRRALNGLAFDIMPMATRKFSKDKIFNLTEKYAIGLQCSGGIELSGCEFETISDNFDRALELLASALNEPSFNKEDIDLAKQRRIAQFQQEEQSPDQHVNALVNTIYYPLGHPYRQIPADAIKQLPGYTAKDLRDYHSGLLNAQAAQIIYVGPKLTDKQLKNVETLFGGWKGKKEPARVVAAPTFDAKQRLVFEHRPIPTAYIRAKFNAPGATSQESATARVLFEILSEVLHEEVRTKRSLSYAIGSMTLQMQQGLGVLVATTSKPKETLETIAQVLKDIKDKPFTKEKLAEYKNVFTTSHYLTLESNDSFAGALSAAQLYFGDPNKLYDFPAKIATVNAADVQKLAKEILTQIRVGIIYDKDKFKSEWVDPLLKI